MTYSRADRALRAVLYALIAGGTTLLAEGAAFLPPVALLCVKVVLAAAIAVRAYVDQSARKGEGGDA